MLSRIRGQILPARNKSLKKINKNVNMKQQLHDFLMYKDKRQKSNQNHEPSRAYSTIPPRENDWNKQHFSIR